MKRIETEIVVIGGGATGTGLVRDLAMRGFKTILVEKGDLASGTTGRFHGLLHSGGRYVVKDPLAARECIDENKVLRKIMPFCIENTGGLFVVTPWDDLNYVDQFIHGCQLAGIPCEEVELRKIFLEEPLLSKKILRCFRLPDASVDSFIAAEANSMAGNEYGAQVLTYHPVSALILADNQVKGVVCRDLRKDETVEIATDLVVNATGAWAGTLLNLAGISVKMVHGKGTMVAINHRIVNTVINRCKMPADGDIIVPAHTVSVLGTTDVPVSSPDDLVIEPWEVNLIIQECEKVIPGASKMRFLRAWAGVRPLYQSELSVDNRDISRAFVLFDHSEHDGVEGLVTITNGKWTTYRKMAEKTADLVCRKLGTHRKCHTHTEVLPDPEYHHKKGKFFTLGSRLEKIEKEKEFGQIICECELVTYKDVIDAVTRRQALTLSDLRRDTRLGMGPCQGCFCTLRATGIWYTVDNQPVIAINQKMLDYVNERWKGVKPVLWGQQLKQEYLNVLVYKSLLHLLNLNYSKMDIPLQSGNLNDVSPDVLDADVQQIRTSDDKTGKQAKSLSINPRRRLEFDVAVIGMGLSGLVAAWRLAKRGLRVGVIAKGPGALHFHTGCIDFLGYRGGKQIVSPLEAVHHLQVDKPGHPFTWFKDTDFTDTILEFSKLCTQAGYPFEGEITKNFLLPTAVGAPRPTCLAPTTMAAGNLRSKKSILVIGFKNFFDFFPKLIADNLCEIGINVDYAEIELTGEWSSQFLSPRRLAGFFDGGDFRKNIILKIDNLLQKKKQVVPQRVALPAVLSMKSSKPIVDELSNVFDIPFFEIPTLPPSIPGFRIERILTHEIKGFGGTIMNGAQVIASEQTHSTIKRILSDAAAGYVAIHAKKYILATGGILGGGFIQPFSEPLKEPIFDLPVASRERTDLLSRVHSPGIDSLPFTTCGIKTNSWFQPVNDKGEIIYDNLHCIGTSLCGLDYLEDLSSEGVALMTGSWIGDHLV